VSGAEAAAPVPLVVVMGVSGAGKTTVGALVADASGVPFLDADGLHPLENVRKMASGTPLTDDDRWPWLDVVGERLRAAEEAGTGLVLACSALKRRYRDRIRRAAPGVVFLHLHGTVEVLASRLEGRSGHFMPASLLVSQVESLEPLAPDERGYVLDIEQPVEDMVAEAARALRALREAPRTTGAEPRAAGEEPGAPAARR